MSFYLTKIHATFCLHSVKITGGVISGIGKGVVASSLGVILKQVSKLKSKFPIWKTLHMLPHCACLYVILLNII